MAKRDEEVVAQGHSPGIFIFFLINALAERPLLGLHQEANATGSKAQKGYAICVLSVCVCMCKSVTTA